jgi:iron complex transport system substrate-binding protein
MRRLLPLLLMLLALAACSGGKGTAGKNVAPTGSVVAARLLSIEHCKGYTCVKVKDPWHSGSLLATYLLVPRDSALPAGLPEGTVVRTPLSRAVVYSSVHTGVMTELGCFDAVKGVTDAQYFNVPAIKKGIADGKIVDCGSSMGPTVEKVIALKPDAILLSPYQDAVYGQITKLGIPVIECADYMEYTPLGRAEWVKFFGELLGKRAQADSIYNRVVRDYNDLKGRIAATSTRPSVVTEMVIGGVWNVPGGHSYMAQFLKDAGANYLWADNKDTGSLNLDFNQVLARAQNADIWLIKAFNIHSYADVKGAYSLNDSFSAFKKRHIYVCDTEKTTFYQDFPFHPEVLLYEYAGIFHPELVRDHQMKYFQLLTK